MVSLKPTRCFAPIAGKSAKVLVLGTLPSPASLAQREYYAHPQNQFWPLMGRLFGAGRDLEYAQRCARLMDCQIAVWDVCAAAHRTGAADAAIDQLSVKPNNVTGFLSEHPELQLLAFNGVTAAHLFERCVWRTAPPALRRLERCVLPSTSPAYAALSPAAKLKRWHTALVPILGGY
jgi:hypoxanthine-DNA glycosylase